MTVAWLRPYLRVVASLMSFLALIIVSARRNLDYASQALLHPGYTGCGPNDDHGQFSPPG